MKVLYSLLILLFAGLFFASCQKELDFDLDAVSEGTMKSDVNGDCLPSTLNGIYYADSTLNDTHFIDVQVNVITRGTYSIATDTVNGYSFKGTGTFGTTGLNTVRLYGSGKPLVGGSDIFTVTYGTSTCELNVIVVAAGTGIAAYTLESLVTGECSGATVFGTYTAGIPLGVTHSVILTVNVISPGTFLLGAASVNGMLFTASGVFMNTGLQAVTLNGAGLPLAPGIFNVTASNIISTCTFSITVGGTSTPAVYSLGGAPGSCTGVVMAGTYQQGLALNASNTALINVSVATAGNYAITSDVVNGVSFSSNGIFSTGSTPVILTGTGTPTAAGVFNYRIFGITDTCSFSITFATPPPPAVFTLSGSPGVCLPATVNGTYSVGFPLDVSNTAIVEVNVTTAGTYTISTNTVNGISFSASGVFTTTGNQPVTLTGTGSPVAVVPTILTPQAGTSSCTFDVSISTGPPAIFTCKIDGLFTSFSDNADATYLTPLTNLSMRGYVAFGTSPEKFIIGIDRAAAGGGPVAVGTYVNTLAGSLGGLYLLNASYTDAAASTIWGPRGVTAATPDPFTIIVTSLTATRVQGTFSGTIRDLLLGGANAKIITEGIFDLPIQ